MVQYGKKKGAIKNSAFFDLVSYRTFLTRIYGSCHHSMRVHYSIKYVTDNPYVRTFMRRALTLSHSLSVKRLKSLNSLVAVTDFLSSDLFILATKKTAKAVFFV